MRFHTDAEGWTIAHRRRDGVGPPLLFLNALGSDQSIWDAVIAHLPRGRAVLTCDLPGHGLSPAAPEAPTIEGIARAVLRWLDALDIGLVVPCGLSVGGMIAQGMAAAAPDRCAALVLVCTAPRIGTAARWNDRIARVEHEGMAATAPEILDAWFPPAFRRDRPDDWLGARTMLERVPPAAYAALCAAIRDADLADETAAIAVPTLCIAGNHDASVPPDAVAAMAAAMPDAAAVTLPTGHLPCLEAPEALADAIRTMLPARDGPSTRRAVLGTDHVKRAEAARTDLTGPFQDLITDGAWGAVWASDAITPRERSMLTLALLAAQGNWDEIAMHVRATARTGATPTDVQQAFQHVAVYAGVPRANHALRIARDVLREMDDG